MGLFATALPEGEAARASLGPFVAQWLDTTNWFVARAHDSGKVAAEHDEHELTEHFGLFESSLGAVVRGFYTTLDELDAILSATNP